MIRRGKGFYRGMSLEGLEARIAEIQESIKRLEIIVKERGTKTPRPFVIQLAQYRSELDVVKQVMFEAVKAVRA